MKPIEELILYTLKHIIERDNMESELKKKTDKDISDKIMKQLFVRETKGVCCDMDENILDGLEQSDDKELRDCVKDESHSEGCNCGFELEKGKEGCGDVIEELVDTDDNGEIIDTRWLHCGEDKQLCDECKEKKFALEEKSE